MFFKFTASRRLQRIASTRSIWPPSPKAPARDLYVASLYEIVNGHFNLFKYRSTEREKSRKKRSKRTRSPSATDTDSEDDRRRRRERRREKERHSSSKHRKHHKKRHEESERDSEDDRRRRRSGAPTKSKSKSPEPEEEDAWVEKSPAAQSPARSKPAASSSQALSVPAPREPEDDLDGPEVGPMPVVAASTKIDERAYGGALLRGEGSAMAAFLQDGERIPRRGEIGLTSNEIDKYEQAGYVMSGSRHRRMNAVRMRKENQVISAEEKRGILKLQKEEREKRENLVVSGFKEMLEDKLKVKPGGGGGER